MATDLLTVPIECVMAEEHGGTSTTRIDSDLLDKARQHCAHTKKSNGKPLKVTEYLDLILRPAILKDHAATMKRITDEQRTKRGAKE